VANPLQNAATDLTKDTMKKHDKKRTHRNICQKSEAETATDQSQAAETSAPKNAVELLKADHRKVEGPIQHSKLRQTTPASKNCAADCTELMVHTKLEEELFIPRAARRTWRATSSMKRRSNTTAPQCSSPSY